MPHPPQVSVELLRRISDAPPGLKECQVPCKRQGLRRIKREQLLDRPKKPAVERGVKLGNLALDALALKASALNSAGP